MAMTVSSQRRLWSWTSCVSWSATAVVTLVATCQKLRIRLRHHCRAWQKLGKLMDETCCKTGAKLEKTLSNLCGNVSIGKRFRETDLESLSMFVCSDGLILGNHPLDGLESGCANYAKTMQVSSWKDIHFVCLWLPGMNRTWFGV